MCQILNIICIRLTFYTEDIKYIKQVRKEKVVLCYNYLLGIDLIPSMYRGGFADNSINSETFKGTLWRGKQCVITYELNSY